MKFIKLFLFLLIASLTFVGCNALDPKVNFDKPDLQIPKKQPEARKNKGSLYSREGASLFADKKDLQIGDIIQITIDEDINGKTDNKRELTNNRTDNLGGGMVVPMGTNNLAGLANTASKNVNQTVGASFNTTSQTSDKGKVQSQYIETFKTSISAIIEETYQNGNYFIKGSKEVMVEGQKHTIIISGVIRPYDITPDNSVSSSQIADLRLMYNKDGTESDVMDTPWGLNLVRQIWPF